jgi:type III restriction enzyme
MRKVSLWIRLTGYARNLFETSSKSVYEYVPKDSEVESRFAQELEEQDEVKLYVKLPAGLKSRHH